MSIPSLLSHKVSRRVCGQIISQNPSGGQMKDKQDIKTFSKKGVQCEEIRGIKAVQMALNELGPSET